MGCGKSTVAAGVAAASGRMFVDLDDVVAAETGRGIPEIFRQEKEAGFRAREFACLQALPPDEDLVLAAGGGLVGMPAAVDLIRSRGPVLWLDLNWVTAWSRLADTGGSRPLVAALKQDDLAGLFVRRRPLYAAAADFRLRSDQMNVEQLVKISMVRALRYDKAASG